MASGDTLLILNPQANEPPAASYATLDSRNGHPCLDFDADAVESAIFSAVLPRNYAGGGLKVELHWSASTDTNNAHGCVWAAAFEAVSGQDIDADGFAAAQSATGNPNATSGIETVTEIAFTNGAQMDSVAAGGLFRLQISRTATDGADDMTGDAELLAVEIKET